ncbi:aminotransferase class I/II-fold pyridoxal phosphate-dependent enzyme [Bradyrhizobium sp. CCGUVB23]|uniref:aminotransferase class I/II-fold pyridoxal phosphate-dependent enzyme n=1 Tax=Bradyrhizobium sp. CCGUVB23 TaxID=2949630 RepID=UPI0020B37708|nr:aminotransferase class I/II-fold pyridoxal phosphate-dependent enzyme [Bradyrhizobium sp. CCGUVB23]MCP3460755.1 aminotransferase class I/II-fold pyridoxal phosphate-dependent enzyme [Bradyrhizobium sp. CCGUVB23]
MAHRTALVKLWGQTAIRTAGKEGTARGEDIIDLTAEEIWSELAPSVREGAIAAINGNLNCYTDQIGLLALRHALARKLSAETAQPWSADEIAVTSGAKQALFNAALALLNPGDEVLIPAPYWTTFPTQVIIAGGTPIFVESRHNNYVPRLTDLAAAITSRTKAVVVNTPNNPTGTVYDRDTLSGIAQLARDRNFWIIFDESYGAFVHPPHLHHSILSVAPQARDRILIVNSFSTSLALTGWRIGYIAGPKAVVSAVKALQTHTTSNPNVIAQHALLYHLNSGDSAFELKLQRHISDARVLGLSILSDLKLVSPPAAQGGLFFYLDLSGFQRRPTANGCEFNPDDIADALLMNAGVATVSGTAFGDPSGLRLSYGVDLELLGKGLRRLTTTLNEWN